MQKVYNQVCVLCTITVGQGRAADSDCKTSLAHNAQVLCMMVCTGTFSQLSLLPDVSLILVDSGTSAHLTNCSKHLINIRPY
eukprot:2635589-Rhodomonas_salina.1